jgi:CheY-like chemotaxis protein
MNPETTSIQNILMAEDDPRDVELTLSALEEHNLASRVTVVDDGAAALDYLYRRGKYKNRATSNPVVVLLDNHMPKVNGLEVLKAMKTDENLKMIPVVVLTSSRETPDLIEFYKHGVNAYVVKPVDFSEFIRAVSQLGVFWAGINEPPPVRKVEESLIEAPGEGLPANKRATNEISPAHPAS